MNFSEKIKITQLFTLIGVIIYFVVSFVHPVFAGIGITITPLKYKLEVEQGDRIERTITVRNPNDFVMRVKAEFQDFKVTTGNNIQWIPDDIENPSGLRDWIDISTEVFSLKPGGEITIPFTITVPRDATPGGHYSAVFYTPVLESTSGGGNVGAVPRVGSLIILNVKGDVIKTGELVDFQSPRFIFSGLVPFTFSFLNTGTTHFETEGKVEIKSIFGGKKTVLEARNKFVYPGITREITLVWEKENPLGIFKAKGIIIDDLDNIYSKSRIFIAIPSKIFFTLLAVILVLYAMLRIVKKKFKFVKREN